MLPDLFHKDDKGIHKLPDWAYFFLELGFLLAHKKTVDNRIVSSIALPTRLYAATLTMTGYIYGSLSQSQQTDDAQIAFILGQEPGTPVFIYQNNNRKLKGIISGFRKSKDRMTVIIKTAKDEIKYLPLDYYASRITVAEDDITIPNRPQKGRQLETPSEFLKCLIGDDAAKQHVLKTSFELLAVGQIRRLQSELCEIPFLCKHERGGIFREGVLQEIVRVRQFSGSNQAYKAQCISASKSQPEDATDEREPPVVIFDGPIAYLRHGHRWSRSHHVVAFDRTESQFLDGIELVNQNYAYRLDEEVDLHLNIPVGIELMMYKEAY